MRLNGHRFEVSRGEEEKKDESSVPDRRRRAIVRAAAIAPVILTVPGKLARAQALGSFGTSLCAPFGLQMIISAGKEPQASNALRTCKQMLGMQ
jgi:hypothetical protein